MPHDHTCAFVTDNGIAIGQASQRRLRIYDIEEVSGVTRVGCIQDFSRDVQRVLTLRTTVAPRVDLHVDIAEGLHDWPLSHGKPITNRAIVLGKLVLDGHAAPPARPGPRTGHSARESSCDRSDSRRLAPAKCTLHQPSAPSTW